VNDITFRNGRQLEDPIVETKTIEVDVESEKPQSDKVVVESEKPNTPPPYKQKIHFPQGFDKSTLDEQFRKFIEIIQDKLPSKLKDPESFSIRKELLEQKLLLIEYKSSTEAKLEQAKVREEKLIKSNEYFKREMKQQAEETNKMMKQMMEMFQKQAQP